MSHVVELVIVVNMNISMYVQERGIYVRVSGMGGSQFEGCGLWYSAAYLVSSRKGESEYVLARGARRTPSGCDVDGGTILIEPVGGGVPSTDVPGCHGWVSKWEIA